MTTPSDTTASEPPLRREPTQWELLQRMFAFVRPVRGTAVLACALVLAWVVMDVYATKMLGRIVDEVKKVATAADAPQLVGATFWERLHHEPMRHIVVLTLAWAGLVVSVGVCTYLRHLVNMKFSMEGVYHMRSAVYDRLQRVGFGFHDEHSTGQLINRALSDLQNVRQFVQNSLLQIVEIMAFVIGYGVLILTMNKWVAITALIPIPFWILYIRRFGRKMQPAQQAQMESADELTTVLSENIAGVHVVKAFATESTEVSKYNRTADKFYGRVMTSVTLWRNFVPVVRGIASASHMALFAVGALLVVWHELEVGALLVFGTAMGGILSRLQQINVITEQYQKAIVSAKRFFEVLDAPATVPEKKDAPPLPPGPGAVEFAFVNFGYDPHKRVLHEITFDAPGGSVIALVGPTGAGKSTLVQLLARFYDPQSGGIYIDGHDVRDYSLDSLRKSVGFVFQETFLFSDTVANNIRYGNPKASMGEVEAAARIAQAHEFIQELPQKYDTMLGERGATLSGGQRQRLAIARAIISNPRFLVLDDALAAVDPETEHLISRALDLVMVDRTVFIIAHRLSTVKAADLVIVLENGWITEAGTHEQLLAQHGHYRHIAEVQLAYQEKEIEASAKKKLDQAAGRR